MQIRQGDVLLEPVVAIPSGFSKKESVNRFVVAYGEVTGHCHEIVLDDSGKSMDVYVNEHGSLCFVIDDPAKMLHEEHGPIMLKGIYVYEPQREYTPQEIRNVHD